MRFEQFETVTAFRMVVGNIKCFTTVRTLQPWIRGSTCETHSQHVVLGSSRLGYVIPASNLRWNKNSQPPKMQPQPVSCSSEILSQTLNRKLS